MRIADCGLRIADYEKEEMALMAETKVHTVGIVMNGVTGRMGTNQHLMRSLVAIIQEGGISVGHNELIMPDPVLVGRNPTKLERLSKMSGVTLEQSSDFARALGWVEIGSRQQVFQVARALMVTRHEDLRLFEILFNRFFRLPGSEESERQRAAAERQSRRSGLDSERRLRQDIATLMAARAHPSDPEIEAADRAATYSSTEVLQGKEFSAMTPEELERVKRLIQAMRWRMSERRTRRLTRGRGRILDLRRTLRQAAKQSNLVLSEMQAESKNIQW